MKTVNFIEAVNSGKRFRPTGLVPNMPETWYSIDKFKNVESEHSVNGGIFNDKAFFSADFELEEKKIEINESEFDYIIDRIEMEQDVDLSEDYVAKSIREKLFQ